MLQGCSCAGAEDQVQDAGGGGNDASVDGGDAGTDAGAGKCAPGEQRCADGREVVEECRPDGQGWEDVETCPETLPICRGDECIDPCMPTDPPSYQGCEYWAVDLENANQRSGGYNPQNAPFAVVVSNTNDSRSAHVTVYTGDADSEDVRLEEDVAPNGVAVLDLGVRNVAGTGISQSSFRIRSTLPISAYQFNPIHAPEAFSADASLLLPVPTLGTRYYAVTGDGITGLDDITQPDTSEWPATVTVVGIGDVPTNVTITPANPIAAGGGIAGDPIVVSLSRYDVLNLSAEMLGGDPGPAGDGNLTGTLVEADAPVVVFSGNPSTVVPHGVPDVCCADHLEEQLFPVSIWGTTFAVPRSPPRLAAAPEDDHVRFVAAEDGTTLSYLPVTPPGAPAALDAGEVAAFSADADFFVTASSPILVAQLLASASEATVPCDPRDADEIDRCRAETGFEASSCVSIAFGSDEGRCRQVGDPSLVQVPPVIQYRSDYVFLIPDGYAHDYVVVVSPEDAEISMDGADVAAAPSLVADVGGVRWVRRRIELADGIHRMNSDLPVGATVFGYDTDVSYAYPAGLDLEPEPIE